MLLIVKLFLQLRQLRLERILRFWFFKQWFARFFSLILVSWFLLVIPVGFLFGAKGLLIGIGIALFAVVVFLLYCIYRNIN